MEVQHLKTFIAVADSGSLTQAAERLHLSQPAVSGQIKALEEALGLRLFHRTSRGMELTAEGDEILNHARDVTNRFEGIDRAAKRLRGEASGTLRLGVVDSGYDFQLARMVGMMSRRYPEVDLKIVGSNSGGNLKALLEHKIDIAIFEGVLEDERIHSWSLGSTPVGVIGPIAWKDDLSQASWTGLAEMPWIFVDKTCSYNRLLRQVGEEHQLQFNARFEAESFGAMGELVAEGLGLSIFDLNSVVPLVADGRVFVWPQWQVEMPVRLIALKSREEDALVTAFAEIANEVHRSKNEACEVSHATGT